jgi:1-acyl-sn-glycerol-3-phosphate acyltransferase/DNA-directed RNA polymerase subunit RPC12/RpoP
MEKQPKKRLQQPKLKRPPLSARLLMRALGLYTKVLYRTEYNHKAIKEVRKIKGPILAISTHSSPMDFAFSNYALRGRAVSMVVSVYLFYDPNFGKLVRWLGNAIPKKQFTADVECVRNIKRMIDAGIDVLIFPEGLFSLQGKDNRLGDGLFKLMKWLKVPVVVIRNNGAYLTRPRYFLGFRRGKTKTDVTHVLTPEDCENLSLGEIKQRVNDAFSYNDCEFQEENKIAFENKKRSTTEGIEQIFWVCPKCLSEYRLKTENHAIECQDCGNRAVLNELGQILPDSGSIAYDRIDKWYDFQYNFVKEKIDNDPNYVLSEPADLCYFDEYTAELVPHDEGVFSLDKTGFTFKGKQNDMHFNIPCPPLVAMELKERIDLYKGDQLCRFMFKENFRPTKFFIAAQILFDKSNKKEVRD